LKTNLNCTWYGSWFLENVAPSAMTAKAVGVTVSVFIATSGKTVDFFMAGSYDNFNS
jgi:hypothetical protein